jgi:hypothetical protein
MDRVHGYDNLCGGLVSVNPWEINGMINRDVTDVAGLFQRAMR